MAPINKNSELKVYLFRYYHDGGWWQFEMPGTSLDDAQARVQKLPLAQPLGELVMKLPVRSGFVARLACFVRNALHALKAA